MTTVLRVRQPRDLLSYVPFRLGFAPRESIVVLCLDGGAGRVGLVARHDLPPLWSDVPSLARVLAALAARDGAASAVLVLYRSGPVPARVLTALTLAFRVADIAVLDVFQVDDERYRCLTCSGPCCPSEGWPLSDLDSSVVGAEMVLQGNVVAPDRAALLADLRRVEAQDADRLPQELVMAEERWSGGTRVRARRRVEAVRVWNAAIERCLAGDRLPLSLRDTARLATAFQDVVVRDAVVLRTVPHGQAAALAHARGAVDDPLVVAALDAAFGAREPRQPAQPPDPDLVQAVDLLLRHLVRSVDGERSISPLAVLAWSAWWRGDGALADLLVDRLLTVSPAHAFGLLLRAAVDQCLPPPWVGSGGTRPGAPG